MAIDSYQKRLSLIQVGRSGVATLPSADGSFDTGDRLHFLRLYSFGEVNESIDEIRIGSIYAAGSTLIPVYSVSASIGTVYSASAGVDPVYGNIGGV